MSPKRAESPRAEEKGEDGKGKDPEPLRSTRRRIRKLVQRHRETFDALTK